MDTALQNALTGGTATLELDKFMYIVEQRNAAMKKAEDSGAIVAHQLIEIMLNMVLKLSRMIPAPAMVSTAPMSSHPLLEECYKLLRERGYSFKYEVDMRLDSPVKVTELTKIP